MSGTWASRSASSPRMSGRSNQVMFFWGFESQADRESRREALEADPDWVAYRKKSADAGNVQHQENKIIKSTGSRRCKVRRRPALHPLRASSTMARNFFTLSAPA